MLNRDKKCIKCSHPVYAKNLCQKHYKQKNNVETGYWKKKYEERKGDSNFMEKKKNLQRNYMAKVKNGTNIPRKYNDTIGDWGLYIKNRRIALRKEVINYYSNGKNKCNRCGYSDLRSLEIDHIDNSGHSHRKCIRPSGIYVWLKNNGYPKGFQVLCKNCNWIKELERMEMEYWSNIR